MGLFNTTISTADVPECAEDIRQEVLTNTQGSLIEGQSIIRIQFVFTPFPRLQTCKVTIGPEDARP